MSSEITLPPQGMNIQGAFQSQSSESVGETKRAGGASEVADILGTDNVTVTENVGDAPEATATSPAAELPELEEPVAKKQDLGDTIDKLVSILQLEDSERQVQMSKERIKTAATILEAEFQERSEKIVILLSLMESLGDRFWVGNSAKKEGAAIAAFAAALVTMAPDDKKAAAFAFMNAISNDARDGLFFNYLDNETLRDGLVAMGLDERKADKVQHLISKGAFGIAAKLCAGTPLADVLDKATTLKETAKKLADKFDIFGRFDSAGFMEESRARAIAKEIEDIFAKIAARMQKDGASALDLLIESIMSNTSDTAKLLAGMKGTDSEIAGQMNQMA